VANQIVRTAYQFILSETAHGGELVVAVSNVAIDVSCGNEPLLLPESLFNCGDRQIDAHFKAPWTAFDPPAQDRIDPADGGVFPDG
jgi:hypothetical protein